MRRGYWLIAIIIMVLLVPLAVAYIAFLPGFSSARGNPLTLEVEIATYLLRHSVPAADQERKNPLGAHPDLAAVREGGDLFMQKCMACHGHDGKGQTEIGPNVLPRVPSLRTRSKTWRL